MTYKLFVQRVGLVGITNLIIGFRGLIMLPILAKTLGVSTYGVWSQIMITISLATPIAMLGLPQVMARFLSAGKDKKEIQEGFYSISFTVLFVSLILSIILAIFSDFFSMILIKNISFSPIIKIAAFMITLDSLDRTVLAFFTARMQMRGYSLFLILQTCIEVGLIAFVVLSGFGIFGAIIALLTSRIIILFVMISYIMSKIGFKLPKFYYLKSYLIFGLPMVPTMIFFWVIDSSDRYIIGYFMDSVQVGIYSAAYGIASMIMMLMNPIGIVLFPMVSKLWDEGQISEVQTYLEYSLKYFLLFAIPSAFGLSVLAKELLLILANSEFISGAILIPFVAAGIILLGVHSIFYYILTCAKHTYLITISLVIASIGNIVLNILFIPKIGVLGAAIATLITYFSAVMIVLVLSRKYLKIGIDLAVFIKSIGASLIMAYLIVTFNPVGLSEVVFTIGGGGLIYIAILFLLGSFNKEEIKIIKGGFRIGRHD